MKYIPIGIDIGHYSVKIIALNKKKTSVKYNEEYLIPYDVKNFYSWLKSIIYDFKKKSKISFASLYFTIPCDTDEMLMRIFDVPNLTKKELSESILYEIQEKLYIEDMNNFSYKWSILDKKDENQVAFITIFKKNVIGILKDIKGLKYKIVTIEPQMVSLQRLISDNSLIIDFGFNNTRVMIYKDNKPYYFQSLNIGSETITQDILNNYIYLKSDKISEKYNEAETIKKERGIILDEPSDNDNELVDLKNIVDNNVKNIIKEIKQTLRSLEVKEEFSLSNFYCIGEGSNLKNFIPYLERELNCNIKSFSIDIKNLEDNSFIVSYSSTLYKDKGYLSDINFLKSESLRINYKNIFVCFVAFFILINIAMIDINRRYDNEITELKNTNNEKVNLITGVQNDIKKEGDKINEYNKIISVIKNVSLQKKWLSNILFELPKRTPKGISIADITITDNLIELEGYADNYSDVGFFAISLEEIGKVKIDNILDINPVDLNVVKTDNQKSNTVNAPKTDSKQVVDNKQTNNTNTDNNVFINQEKDVKQKFKISFYPNNVSGDNNEKQK